MSSHFNSDAQFYQGKKVLVTGHTGFKGSWMCKVLTMLGAQVTGYSLEPSGEPALYELCHAGEGISSVIGDVRDLDRLLEVFQEVRPEMVIHMAAQPLVRESYRNPVDTYGVNVMGTVHVLECVRRTDSVRSVINVTTDKVYRNLEQGKCFQEDDELNGYDPYSNSKSCSELVTSCYKNSFLQDLDVAVSTVRAGNVIGGGDFAKDRIVPDCFRAVQNQKELLVRNPYAIRPFQHVLEPVFVYLMIGKRQYEDRKLAGCYNVGPKMEDCYPVGELVQLFGEQWKARTGNALSWIWGGEQGPKEAGLLRLDCGKLRRTFDWEPVWMLGDAVEKTVEWYDRYLHGGNVSECMEEQIGEFYEKKAKISRHHQ